MIRLIKSLAVTRIFVLGVDSHVALAADWPTIHLLVGGADIVVLRVGAITSHPPDMIGETADSWLRTVGHHARGGGRMRGGGAEDIENVRLWSEEMGHEDRPVVEAGRGPLEPLLRLPAKSDRAWRRSYRQNPLALLQRLCHVREQE